MVNPTLSLGMNTPLSSGDNAAGGSGKKELLILPLWNTKMPKSAVARVKNINRNRNMPHSFQDDVIPALYHCATQRTYTVHGIPYEGNTGVTNRTNAATARGDIVKRIEIQATIRPLT